MTKHSPSKEHRNSRLRKRQRAETRFQWYGRVAVGFGFLALAILLCTVFRNGLSGFFRTTIALEVDFAPDILGLDSPTPSAEALQNANFDLLLKQAVYNALPAAQSRAQKRAAVQLFSPAAPLQLHELATDSPDLIGTTVTVALIAASVADQFEKGRISRKTPEIERGLSDEQIAWLDMLRNEGRLVREFDTGFLFRGDSRNPEQAGIGGALAGSFFALLVCLVLAFPLGVATAVYLEEFSKKNRWTEFVEININNLAAVPSIIYGLLGLAIILQLFGVPRSSALAGGVVLALMTLPTIIIAARAALKAVPPSIRQGALAMGASPTQVILHHVLPAALPGTFTGTLIGLARALGETAPLLMIGMVAFIADVPKSPLEPAAALPVQVYLWAESVERGFIEKTSTAIIVILLFLALLTVSAVLLRRRFEQRWH